MTRGADDDLEERIDELESALDDLSEELRGRAPRGPMGLPRPPTPGELLRFTDQAAIPAAIAILEANIRLLEAFRHAIRLMESGDRTRQRGETGGEDVATLGRRTLNRFDDALADLERVVDGSPTDVPGHDVLAEARALREDLASRITDAERMVAENGRSEQVGLDSDTNGGTAIDIDEEIESIKREQGTNDEDDEGDEGGSS